MERAYYLACRALGRLLRSGRYSEVRIDYQSGGFWVRKYRFRYAPLLVWLGDPLMRILDTGVRVLPRREWEERERRMYESLHGFSIRIDNDGALVLPRLAGETLANLLKDRELKESVRTRAIALAVTSLAALHARGFTHGDAMADNVMVDLDAGVARWFDFETVHEARRHRAWRRADDVRALLATCLLRTTPAKRADTLRLILDSYADQEVLRILPESFDSVFRRPLTFHLGQAGLTLLSFMEIARLLRDMSASNARR
jgi:serine/threonine protein kinase